MRAASTYLAPLATSLALSCDLKRRGVATWWERWGESGARGLGLQARLQRMNGVCAMWEGVGVGGRRGGRASVYTWAASSDWPQSCARMSWLGLGLGLGLG